MKRTILFTSYGLWSHASHCLVLAREMAERGHEVLFASQEQVRAWLPHKDIRFVAWHPEVPGHDEDLVEHLKDVRGRATEVANWYRSAAMVSNDLARIYPPVYHCLKPVLEKIAPDLLVTAAALVPAIDLAYELKLPCLTLPFFLPPSLRRHPLLDPARPRNRTGWWKRCISAWGFMHWKLAEFREKKARQSCGAKVDIDEVLRFFPTVSFSAPCVEAGRSFTPNVHFVGPVLPRHPPQPSDGLKEWIQQQEQGFVYAAFGTLVRIGPSQVHRLAKGLSECGLPVLWSLPGPLHAQVEKFISPQFKLVEFAPQLAVLAGDGVRAFVSHAGASSTMEALYYGKPLVAFPFFLDQAYYASRIEALGAGIRLDPFTFESDAFHRALKDVLHCPDYAAKASEVSRKLQQYPGVKGAADLAESLLEQRFNTAEE